MFTHMVPVKTVTHRARDIDYELLVYQVAETGEYRIYIAKGEIGVGALFSADQEIVQDAKNTSGIDLVEDLIQIAKDDIDKNEFNLY